MAKKRKATRIKRAKPVKRRKTKRKQTRRKAPSSDLLPALRDDFNIAYRGLLAKVDLCLSLCNGLKDRIDQIDSETIKTEFRLLRAHIADAREKVDKHVLARIVPVNTALETWKEIIDDRLTALERAQLGDGDGNRIRHGGAQSDAGRIGHRQD